MIRQGEAGWESLNNIQGLKLTVSIVHAIVRTSTSG